VRGLVDGADRHDATVAHTNVGAPAGCTRAVDDVATLDQQIKHGRRLREDAGTGDRRVLATGTVFEQDERAQQRVA
jgi:hypothetical protein